MSWFRKIVPIVALFWFAGCSSETAPDAKITYFDIRGFFTSESTRLGKKNPIIHKTVTDNGTSEVREVNISNWENELALFIESDINKPSWKNSYKVENKGTAVIYTALYPDVRTKQLTITMSAAGKVKHIQINNKTTNVLYTSEEHLNYYPDSLYRIDKFQDVKILGSHRYTIEGKW